MKLFQNLKPPEPDLDNTPLRFGKHKGLTPEQVAKVDPGWIVWAYEHIHPAPFSKSLALACEVDERERDGDLFDEDYPTFHEY